MDHEGDGGISCNRFTWNDFKMIGKGTGKIGNQKTSRNHPSYSFVKISQNIEKSPGDLRRIAVSQTPVKDHELALVGKKNLQIITITTVIICRLYGDRDETINHIISECSKLAQKEYMARHDWVGKVVHCEMSRKFQFDHKKQMVYAQPGTCPRKWLA